ncbi:putative hexose carrier protein [Aspergillus steynii IBT 23096]|uniref:Putative hexose carrier protein n=1 Tax=Aspergillus steynii IBT 23096 TaxID=1392250 RepID=A0A2I2GCJ6_9EURO|nr:putative hexose carrier protein [Aspergillus steynii IBT 23096]PLB50585.1 putative hexose carrier protein [Aspergillus steynii IBT 23096]
MVSRYVVLIALVVALGGFVYGVDSGIIATTLGHDSFKYYMFGPSGKNAALTGAIVSLYNVGQAVGTFGAGYSANRFSRRWTICASAVIAIIGTILQTAAVNPGMMIAGRFLAGVGCGILLAVVPIYIAEVSPPKQRGMIVGLQGFMISIGFFVANWIGYGGAYAKDDAQWRIPLAMQIPGPVALTIGCCFIPYRPRWLIQQERYEEARAVLEKLHVSENDEDVVLRELAQIREQIHTETEHVTSFSSAITSLLSPRYMHRTLMACFILSMGQFSGSTVIQNYQNNFYATVGFTGKTSLLISGIYGIMGVLGQVIYLCFAADKWPRTRTLWVGSIFLCVMIAICMALSAMYGDKSNGSLTGARAAIAMIFLYSCGYAVFFNATIWVVPSELFPFFLRSTGMGLAVFCKSVSAIILSQITPTALQNVSWRYYALFIATNFAAAFVYFFLLPETSGKTLEEIAELFGDGVAKSPSKQVDDSCDKDAPSEKQATLETNDPRSAHVERIV